MVKKSIKASMTKPYRFTLSELRAFLKKQGTKMGDYNYLFIEHVTFRPFNNKSVKPWFYGFLTVFAKYRGFAIAPAKFFHEQEVKKSFYIIGNTDTIKQVNKELAWIYQHMYNLSLKIGKQNTIRLNYAKKHPDRFSKLKETNSHVDERMKRMAEKLARKIHEKYLPKTQDNKQFKEWNVLISAYAPSRRYNP